MDNSSTPFNSPSTLKVAWLKAKAVANFFKSTPFSPEGEMMEDILEEMETDDPPQPAG